MFLLRLHKYLRIQRWRRVLGLTQHLKTFNRIFSNINGFILSKQARTSRDALEYTYGEIEFEPFIALLSLVHPNSQTIFYDLGSGVGKAVIACSMVFDVKKSCGIEFFPELHRAAVQAQQELQYIQDYANKAALIQWIQGDFLSTDFGDATLIFVNATGFFGDTWIALNHHLAKLPQGVIVITTSKGLISNAFEIFKTTPVQMSWGVVTAYLHRRLNI